MPIHCEFHRSADVNAIIAFDFDIATVGPVPPIDDVDDADSALVRVKASWCRSAIVGIGLDLKAHKLLPALNLNATIGAVAAKQHHQRSARGGEMKPAETNRPSFLSTSGTLRLQIAL